MAKFRVRNLINRVPFLDGLRLSVLAHICNHGTNFFNSGYSITKFVSPGAQRLLDSGKPVIFAVYHGRMIGLLRMFHPRKKLSVLISQSRDGEIIARACIEMGFSVARGSPARGAVQGGLQMIKAAESGQNLVVLVDGPRGPIYKVKPGIIRMAELTGLPIVPFACSARRYWKFWGWDQFMGSHWGSPEIYVYGEPIFVDRESSEEQREKRCAQLDAQMNSLREAADAYWNAVA